MPRLFAALVAALLVALAAPVSAQTPEHSTERVEVTNPDDGTVIVINVFKPGTASADAQAPVILHSHGWGGSRSTSIGGDVQAFLNAGFGVVSIDQRGHGESGGQANVQDPTMETEDIKAVIDHIATLDWVLHDTDAGGAPIADDPVLGAVGGSYGGGYQTMTTLDEIADEGRTRLDALAPEITWYDLPESLAPQKVVRTAWNTALYAAGASMLPQYVHEAFAWGATSGQWPDGTLYGESAPAVPDLDSEFHEHGPVAFAERGVQIDIPVLLRQGTSDNLFNLNQGLDIFHKAVTDEARSESYFIAFNGGHALPNAVPPGKPAALALGGGADACSGDWTQLRIDFFRHALAGDSTAGLLPAQYNFTDLESAGCFRFDSFERSDLTVDPLGTGSVVSTAGLGAPLHLEVAQGPMKITGVPKLEGTAASVGLDNRAFFGLSVGSNPADAAVIQNNLMPLRVIQPSTDAPFDIELPGVSVEIPEGQSLFLTVSPISDMYFGHGSKTPGGFLLSDLTLSLPSPGEAGPVEDEPVPTTLTLRREGKGSQSQLVATLSESASSAPVAGATIDFSSGGESLGSATTGADGVATLPLSGKYRAADRTFEATFGGSEAHEGSGATTS